MPPERTSAEKICGKKTGDASVRSIPEEAVIFFTVKYSVSAEKICGKKTGDASVRSIPEEAVIFFTVKYSVSADISPRLRREHPHYEPQCAEF